MKYIHVASRYRKDRRGAASIEFAIVAPFLLSLVFMVFAASLFMSIMNGLEQLTAGAARSALAGLSETERKSLATTYVTTNAAAYPYLDPAQLQVSTSSDPVLNQFTVAVSYSMATNRVYSVLKSLVPVVPTTFRRQAVIVAGGS